MLSPRARHPRHPHLWVPCSTGLWGRKWLQSCRPRTRTGPLTCVDNTVDLHRHADAVGAVAAQVQAGILPVFCYETHQRVKIESPGPLMPTTPFSALLTGPDDTVPRHLGTRGFRSLLGCTGQAALR